MIPGYGGYGGGGVPQGWEPTTEQAALVLGGARARVGGFATSLEYDEQLLQQASPSKERLSYEEGLAVRYRIAQKRVAQAVLSSLEALTIFTSP